jgi:hypothetical protein
MWASKESGIQFEEADAEETAHELSAEEVVASECIVGTAR